MKKINSLKLNFYIAILVLFTHQTWAKDLVSITAVGDVMMATTYPISRLPDNQGMGLFDPAKSWIQASDIKFANFEGTFFEGAPQPDGKMPGPNRYLFQTPVAFSKVLSESGINVVSLSNNHAKDFGQAGLESTKKTLSSVQIQYSSKTGEVARFKVDQTNVVLIAVDYYKPPRSITYPGDTFEEIKKLKSEGNLVIVSAHAGGEGQEADVIPKGPEIFLGENRGDSILFARTAIGSGADLIIMHGPHVPRGLELYNERLIAYSLGNFMTGHGISLSGKAGLAPLLRVQIDHQGRFKTGQIVSFVQKRSPQRIELDPQAEAYKLMVKLSQQQFSDSPLVFESNGLFQ